MARRWFERTERAWLDRWRRPPVPAAVRDARVRVLLYCPSNLNLVDGSSIWVESVAATLVADPDIAVTLPLRRPESRDVITGALRRLPRVELIPASAAGRPDRYGARPAKVLDLIERLDRDRRFDAIIIRSFTMTYLAVDRPAIADRLWSTYVVEPERDMDDPAHRVALSRIARGSYRLVAQSEPMRALTEQVAPESRGKIVLLPPGIPALPEARVDPDRPLRRLVYVGKLHPFYSIPAVVAAFRSLQADHPDLTMDLLGDKIDGGPLGAAWAAEVEGLLGSTPGLAWHGAVPRDEVARRLAAGGVAISCWDHRYGTRMNDLVVSTKLLDYAAVGMPIVLNRTQAQVSILGADYPLFIDGPDDLEGALRLALTDPAVYRAASKRTFEAARAFTYDALAAGLGPLLHEEATRNGRTPGAAR